MTRLRNRVAREEGAVVLLVAVMMAVFLMILALVADLAMLRMDRRTDRLAADAAVTADGSSVNRGF